MAVSIAGMVVLPSLYAIMNLSSCGNGDYSLPWYRISNLGMFVNSFYPIVRNKITAVYRSLKLHLIPAPNKKSRKNIITRIPQ